MKTKIITTLFLIFSFGLFEAIAQEPCKEVIGYYPGWQWYDRDKLVNPESIDYSKYTIINYAFLYPIADGTIQITDPWGDKNLLLGTINWALAPPGYESAYDLGNPEYHLPNTSLIYHAHTNDVKVMISIGGWTLSTDFPGIASDPTKRTNFAHWCNELIRIYDIDGIDIDWEYPGYEPHGGTAADVYNYTLLLQEIRDSLDAIEPIVSKDLMLTAAFGAAPDRMDDIEWESIVEILDYINLMSYDFFGAFDAESNHNSPLYAPAEGDPTFNIHSAVERLINDYSVPESKINMGVAFYGRSAKTVSEPGLHVPITGATDAATFGLDEGSPQYYNVLDKMDLFEAHWDNTAKVPYLTGLGDLKTFVSYDDEASIGLKAQYVVDEGLAGVIIWEITGDYLETSPGSGIIAGTPLADTLNLVLCHAPSDGGGGDASNLDATSSAKLKVHPNPTTAFVNVEFDGSFSYELTDINGAIILKAIGTENEIISMENLATGLYFLTIKTNDEVNTVKVVKE